MHSFTRGNNQIFSDFFAAIRHLAQAAVLTGCGRGKGNLQRLSSASSQGGSDKGLVFEGEMKGSMGAKRRVPMTGEAAAPAL